MKHTLLSALDGDKQATNKLCDEFRCIAVAYLRTKASRNNFLLQYLYKDIDDLALDCIADLLGREKGCLKQLEEYLDREEITELKESEVFGKIRRLIFSKVNEGLYRNYKNFDPSLSKIIRNLKRNLEESKIDGVTYKSSTGEIIFGEIEKPAQLPDIPEEILEIKLSGRLSEVQNSIDAIQQLKNILEGQDVYAKKIPLTGFAIILRKTFAYRLEIENDKFETKTYSNGELKFFINKSIEKQEEILIKTYVHSGKICPKNFQKYLCTVKDILRANFVEDSPRQGYYEHFGFYFPEVDYDRYRKNHRQMLEYLVKKIRSQLVLEIKNENNFSRKLDW